MIGLIDGNNFYVSCERIFDLSLAGRPVAVMSNNDGCVISRSYECKALNIPMGMPYFQLKMLIPGSGLIVKSSNYELYGDISRRMIAVLHEFTPDVEQYSIDEAFVHVALPAGTDYRQLAGDIREKILRWIGIPCGVGFAKSKTLAKIANHIGKKSSSGVFVMPDDPEPILAKLPVREVWGVGGRLAPKLEAFGIRTAWQLAMTDEAFLRQKFNIVLAKTARELRGESVIDHGVADELSQSISCSRSFGHPVVDLTDLMEAVSHYTALMAEKLRREGQRAAGVNVYFQLFPEYEPEPLPGGFTSTTITFATPSANVGDMLSAITPKLKGIFVTGRRYKKAGVVFFGLESGARQMDLFGDSSRDEKSDRLSEAMDKINRQFGKGTVFNLAEGVSKPWSMKRELLSSSYTTKWNQIPEVK